MIPTTEIHVAKTNSAVAVVPGTNTTYTITVKNDGPSTLVGGTVVDNMPTAVTNVSWTCSAAAGFACPAASGIGNLNQVVTLGKGGLLTYQITGKVPSTLVGTLINTASVVLPTGTVDPTPLDHINHF